MIDAKELAAYLKKKSSDMDAAQIEALIEQIDYHGNHQINYTEFLTATMDFSKYIVDDRRLKAVF